MKFHMKLTRTLVFAASITAAALGQNPSCSGFEFHAFSTDPTIHDDGQVELSIVLINNTSRSVEVVTHLIPNSILVESQTGAGWQQIAWGVGRGEYPPSYGGSEYSKVQPGNSFRKMIDVTDDLRKNSPSISRGLYRITVGYMYKPTNEEQSRPMLQCKLTSNPVLIWIEAPTHRIGNLRVKPGTDRTFSDTFP